MRCADHVTENQKLGYVAWHVKAAESERNGVNQTVCDDCGRWFFPWERVKSARKRKDGGA